MCLETCIDPRDLQRLLISLVGHVYPALSPGGLGPAGEVNGVAEETVTGHPLTDHPRHHFTGVDAHCDALGNKRSRRRSHEIIANATESSQDTQIQKRDTHNIQQKKDTHNILYIISIILITGQAIP